MNAKKLGFERNIISSFTSMALHPGRSRSLAIPCFTKGEVCHRAASELANTDSASKLTCRHMMTSQFRSERGKTRKREISRDFSRFFDSAFFRSFIDPFCPFRCCVRTRTCESAKTVCYQFVESISRSAVFLSKFLARLRLKTGRFMV